MDERSDDKGCTPEILFVHLVAMFQAAAMQQMGKIINPATNKVERDLEQARFSIDILEMLKEKTRGNLAKEEEELLDKVLFELHMNYVDEVKRSEKEKDATGKGSTCESSSGGKAGPRKGSRGKKRVSKPGSEGRVAGGSGSEKTPRVEE